METNQLLLAYPEADEKIRTNVINGEIFFCLSDVASVLSKQNTKLSQNTRADGLSGLISAILEVLEPDELTQFEDTSFVTQPGLFRIILRDNSKACKQFQRWVLHDVLPSIQKHGTYPPPVVDQDSDVKRIVKSLLLEIEQRERLERETKEQFQKHETKLSNLENKLLAIESSGSEKNYISVYDYCVQEDIDTSHVHLIRGWCIKLCAEGFARSRKTIKDGKETLLFPIHVVSSAAKEATSYDD